MPLRLGRLELASNLLLAPLAGWTSLAFRLVVREIGGLGMATTEVVAVKALLSRSARTHEILRTEPADRPLAVQISAGTPEEARDAALLIESAGYAAVDLNLGCPVRKIAGKGGGAGLARDLDQAAAVARAAAGAVRIPVTAKMRLGWAPGDLTAPDLARALAQAGVAAVAIHGRTRAQGFSGKVDRSGIRAVVAAVPEIPVIANGDVTDAVAAKAMLDETGAAGLLIGRAAITNPWFFRETERFLETGERPPAPPLDERLAACERHFRLLARDLPENVAARRFRKVLRAWSRALGAGADFWDEAARIQHAADLSTLLAKVRARFGENVTPVTSPAPGCGEALEPAIPVPAGPVDLW